MILVIECILICVIMWLICYFSTGSDDKNLAGLRSYPLEVQETIRNSVKYRDKVPQTNMIQVFMANLVVFMIILLVFGLFTKSNNFKDNFINILILGEVLNLFDLIVIDLLWWRNTKRIRFSDIPEKKAYQNPKQHIESFFRGALMCLIVAIVDGMILTIL